MSFSRSITLSGYSYPAVLTDASITSDRADTPFDDENKGRADWQPFRTNPWMHVDPPTHSEVRDEGKGDLLVDRSRTSLRKWMDENPY